MHSVFQIGMFVVAGVVAGIFLATPAMAEQVPPDKSGYSLLNPTPEAYLRELNPDRPDKTEGPYTVDAGHLQIEMDGLTFTHDRDTSGGGDVRRTAYAVAPVNLKLGLLNNVDLQMILETWNYVRVADHVAGTAETMSGFGDITGRIKINFWGNEGGPTALGLIPFVKLPTNQNDLGNHAVEGGIILPLVIKLPCDFELGAMTECDCARNATDDGYHATFINSVTVDHDLFGKLAGYVEFYSEISAERGAGWIGTLDMGVTYTLTESLQLDAGINIGLTPAADDFNVFTGLTLRH